MRLLLDTHAFLWVITDDPALSAVVRREVTSVENSVWLSAASAWEIAIKFGLGKLPLPEEPGLYVPRKRQQSRIELMPIGEPEVCQVHRLPQVHRDPFDRLLIAQANCHGLILVTNDPIISQYPVRTLW